MHFLSYPPPMINKMFWAHFHDFCVQKRTCLPWSPDAFWRFSLCKLKKRLWVHFLDFCVQKQRYFQWISDAFWKFSAWKFYRKSSRHNFTSCLDALWKFSPFKLYKKSSGCIFPIYSSKNEAVCCGIQTHFESTLFARFTENVLGAIPRYVCPTMKLFAVKFRRILEVFAFQTT